MKCWKAYATITKFGKRPEEFVMKGIIQETEADAMIYAVSVLGDWMNDLPDGSEVIVNRIEFDYEFKLE